MMKIKKTDLILEWLAFHLPFSGRKGHEKVIVQSLNNVNARTVLDVGCGQGVHRLYRDYESTGIDIYADDLVRAKALENYKTLINKDIRDMNYPDKSFDAVTAIEIIEHLKKEDGIKLLDIIERIAGKVVVITTPWGDDLKPKYKWNPFLDHQSGWLPKEFEARGYKTYPLLGLRWRFGNNIFITAIIYAVSLFIRPILKAYPDKLCNGFAAVKFIEVDKNV
jgi:ubiquinone/menaquinone biosynthesis C-methylase UbiE